jgi:hypothetical protein
MDRQLSTACLNINTASKADRAGDAILFKDFLEFNRLFPV